MATSPYYDKVLPFVVAQRMLSSLGAEKDASRSTAAVGVYVLTSKGEAMVERKGNELRVRLFQGKCAC